MLRTESVSSPLAITTMGTRQSYLEQVDIRLEDRLFNLTNLISREEDADIMEGASKVQFYQTALEAALRSTQMIFESLQIF